MYKPVKVKQVPVPKGAQHPKPKYNVLPKHEFTMGIIAPKGSGKTTLIVNLLLFYSNYFHTIIVFSPSLKADEKWDWVKEQPLLKENNELKDWLQHLKSKKQNKIVQTPLPQNDIIEKEKVFTGKIPEVHFFTEYSENDLEKIMDDQQKMIDLLHSYGVTKHVANRVLIVFDDLVGSSLFSSKKDNPFKKLNANHRHYSFSMMMVTQAYKEIPKTVRTQYSCIVFFEIANEKELEVIYQDFPMGYKYEDWLKIYHYCTQGDHDFCFIDFQKPKHQRIMKNFDEFVEIKKNS